MADTTITVELIASDDINLKASGTARASFSRTKSDGSSQTVYKLDGADIQFRSKGKTLNDLVDGGGDVDLDLDHLHLTDKDATPVGDVEIFGKNQEVHFRNSDDSAFVDIQAAGGFKLPFHFKRVGVVSDTAQEQIEVLGMEIEEYVMAFPGSIIGISINADAACTTGLLFLVPSINGTLIAGLGTILSTIIPQYNYSTIAKDTAGLTFNAGDRLGCLLTTSSDWLPSGIDILVTIIVEM